MNFILVTNSGKQVIALGIILFLLITAYHGLQLFYYVRMRRRNLSIIQKKLVMPSFMIVLERFVFF